MLTRRQRHRGAIAALSLALAGLSPPAVAQTGLTLPGPLAPCASFARDDDGGWVVRFPVRFAIGPSPADFPPGARFAPGDPAAAILDTRCGGAGIFPRDHTQG